MAERSVTYCSNVGLTCRDCTDAEVVLCLNSDIDLVEADCQGDPSGSGTAQTDLTTIEATLTSYTKSNSCCGTIKYKYTFTYDDEVLVDPDAPLSSSDINGVFCKGCLTTWVEQLVGDPAYMRDNGDGTITFVSSNGCEYTFSGALIP